MRRIFLLFMMVAIFESCQKDKVLLTGDIMGKITVYNQDLSASNDNSGVQVGLYSGGTLLETKITDTDGRYRFENIQYGKYSIDLQKDNYLKQGANYSYKLNHIGGYSPSIKDGSLYKVPDYVLTIDSLKAMSSAGELLVYLKIDGSREIPFSFYTLVGYFGNDQTVSKDNYSFMTTGIVANSFSIYSYADANAVMYDIYRNFSPDTIYIRFYLLTFGQSVYSSVYKEGLGKPSNPIGFIWQ
jgi:hypothetical protein